MIITATSEKDAHRVKRWLKRNKYEYKYSVYWSEEWRRGEEVIFLHKGYDSRGRINEDWRGYTL